MVTEQLARSSKDFCSMILQVSSGAGRAQGTTCGNF